MLFSVNLISLLHDYPDTTSIDSVLKHPNLQPKQSTQMAITLVTLVMNEVQSRTNLDGGKLKEVFSPDGS